jgi:translation initiation factor IF-2
VLLEGYGGNVSYQEISAKAGQGVNELLDLILLTSDIEELTYDPKALASGFILEAKLDRRRGITATAIVKNGTLKTGDYILAGEAHGKIKTLENFLGKKTDSAVPSSPVLILGFESLPKAGDEFVSGPEVKPVEKEKRIAAKPSVAKAMEGEAENALRVILKADVTGSLEALSEVVKNLPLENKKIEIVGESVGDISDGDVKFAVASQAIIIGFKVDVSKPAETLARAQNVKIISSEIIYELIKALEEQLISRASFTGKLEILAVFSKKGTQQIIGGRVTEGQIPNNATLDVERRGETIGTGRVLNLQQAKKDIKVVAAGNECGLMFDSEIEIKVGDILLAH